MAKSKKPAIIEKLFDDRWDTLGGTLSDPVVTRAQLREELRAAGMAASEGNINNFFKDFVRKATRNANWPKSIAGRGYTARQGIKEGAVMIFEPIPGDRDTPFPGSPRRPTRSPTCARSKASAWTSRPAGLAARTRVG